MISFLVANAELSVNKDQNNLIELNKQLDKEITHFNHLNQSIEIIAYDIKSIINYFYVKLLSYRKKLEMDYEETLNLDNLEKQLSDLQISINELEAWHTRTSNCNFTQKFIFKNQFLFFLDYPS